MAAVYQKTEPYEQYVEVVHVTSSSGHEFGQAYCSTCNEDVVFFVGYHHVHLEIGLRNHHRRIGSAIMRQGPS